MHELSNLYMEIHRSVSSYQNLLTSGDHALILCLLVLTIQQLVHTILIELQTGLLNYSNVHTHGLNTEVHITSVAGTKLQVPPSECSKQ